ncbi:MAG: UDP-glycosyltransferase [Flavobacterium sp.]
MKNNILVVVESLDINDSSATKGRVSLIQNLILCGFKLKVLHYSRKKIDFTTLPFDEKYCLPIKEKKIGIFYFLSRIERIFTRVTKISLNKYFENWFGFSFTHFNDVNSICSAIQKENFSHFQIVLTLSKGANFKPHFAMLKANKWQSKWVAYIHDPYPYHFYPKPYNWKQPGYIQKEKLFREVSEKAKFAIFPSKLLKDWMVQYFPNFKQTGLIIPHQMQEFLDFKTQHQDILKPTDFNILHAGSLMRQRNPDSLIKGFQLFLQNNPNAVNHSKLIFIGAGDYFEELILNLGKDFSKNILLIKKPMPFNLVFNLQKLASVNVILESDAEFSPFLPGKFPHCIIANKPILLVGPPLSETKRLLGDNYKYWSEAKNVNKIYDILGILYDRYQNNILDCSIEYQSIKSYLGSKYLEDQFNYILQK